MTTTLAPRGVLPGFGPALGLTLFYLGLLVLLPLAALVLRTSGLDWEAFRAAAFGPRELAAYRISFGISFLAALANALIGLPIAWVLTRYDFPGRRLADALIDLPFALPTAVAGIALASLYSENGLIGRLLFDLGLKVAFTPAGVFIALVFVGLPFVVRTIQPILQDLDLEREEAAATLGASRWQVVARVVFPEVFPALITGFALAFARGIGEYGSVIFIAGNLPGISEIAPLLIVTKLEQYDYAGAAAIGTVMLGASFLLLFLINLLQSRVAQGPRIAG
jgi:sulfate transport system permease protein